MVVEFWSSAEDDAAHLDAEGAAGWISSGPDEGSGDDLIACSQPGSWAEAIGISQADWIEFASPVQEQAHDDTHAPMHASSHSMARQHGFGGYEGLDSLHKGNGAPLHSHSFGDTSPTPSRFRSPTITIQSLERVAAMQCDLEDRERKYRKTGRW